MKIALMTFQGTLHKIVEWDSKTDKNNIYLKLSNEPDCDHYIAALAIRPEDVNEYVERCRINNEKLQAIEADLIRYKAMIHHKLIPFK